MKKQDRITKMVKARTVKRTHKFGIEIPLNAADAVRINLADGNRLWKIAIKKEIYAVCISFEILDDDANIPPS